MEFDTRHAHIALAVLWKSEKHSGTLTADEHRHLTACDRCGTAMTLCRQSDTLEEAERRYKVFVINS